MKQKDWLESLPYLVPVFGLSRSDKEQHQRQEKNKTNNQHFWSINISCLFWGFFSLTWATVLFLTLCKSQNLFPNKNVPFFSKLKIILTFAKNTVKDRDCTYVTNQPPNINPEAKYRDQSFVGYISVKLANWRNSCCCAAPSTGLWLIWILQCTN